MKRPRPRVFAVPESHRGNRCLTERDVCNGQTGTDEVAVAARNELHPEQGWSNLYGFGRYASCWRRCSLGPLYKAGACSTIRVLSRPSIRGRGSDRVWCALLGMREGMMLNTLLVAGFATSSILWIVGALRIQYYPMELPRFRGQVSVWVRRPGLARARTARANCS